MKKNNVIILVFVAVVLIVVAFFGGKAYGQTLSTHKTGTTRTGQYAMGGSGGFRGAYGTGGMNGTVGQVVSKDATSIIVSLPTGGSKVVLYSPSTTVAKTDLGSISDVTTGQNIVVVGTANSDGSITAQSIQIRPASPATTTASLSSSESSMPIQQ